MNNHSSGDNEKMLNFIAETIELIRDQMATKGDLAELEARMATKDDLARLESRLESKIEALDSRLEAKTTAIRGDIEQVQLRLGTVERAVTTRLGQVETEVSRIRSVVYLLVKDQPDLMRLLGQG